MPHLLSSLLAADEPLFSLAIRQLEDSSGRPGMDVRLISEIIEKIHKKSRALDLDTKDTTGEELYHALLNKIREHDLHLVRQLGGNEPDDVQILIPLIKKAAEESDAPRSAWVLKRSVAKRILQNNPPLSVMKQLKYTSIDSMIKRENLAEIYGALRFAESPAWLKKFNSSYKNLQPSDFETREIEIIIMDKLRWGRMGDSFVKKKRHNITHLKELGVILMLPTSIQKLPGIAITALPLLFHYINEIRLYSAFFKLQQVKPDFGKIIAETLNADIRTATVMAGTQVHWRVIQRYYGKLENENHPEIFEPHVQPEDLHWRRAEEYMYKIDPELKFWHELDYVGAMAGNSPVSFNLMDVSISYCTQAPYEQRAFFHMRESLWNELFMRYMGHKVLETQILQQLDNNMIKPEKLRV
ncbi:hypothetical protein H0V99_02660 [Candidatus Saccharibacteria bacterium]|nr:hypothetical protein [Candidatus Saccharibacteria bacterium]